MKKLEIVYLNSQEGILVSFQRYTKTSFTNSNNLVNTSPNKKSVTKEEIFHYFYSSENIKALETYRSFNQFTKLKQEQKGLLRRLFFERKMHVTDFPDKQLEDLLKLGIVDYTGPNTKEITWSLKCRKNRPKISWTAVYIKKICWESTFSNSSFWRVF